MCVQSGLHGRWDHRGNVDECQATESILVCDQAGVLCEDAACYEAVNGLDPFCDDNNWDEFCVACAASQPGYAGLDCSSVGAACETEKVVSPCAEQASCMDTEGSFTCTCDAGYEGDGFSCANIDECAQEASPCDPNAQCFDSQGGFECVCGEGYFGDGFSCCEDGDGDMVCTGEDVCPGVADPDQVDSDEDGIGDACECFEGITCDDGNPCTDDSCDPAVGCVRE